MTADRPTFHESWYRVAELRPRLRSTVQTYRQHFRGRTWIVVQDPSNNQHFRLDEAGYRFVGLLDGRRTVQEVWRLCNDQLGDAAPTQGEVINMLGQLYTSNLLRSDLPADAAGMFENYRKRVHREIGGFFMNLLFMRIPVFDPDHLLDRWVKVVGPVFSPFGVAAWVILLLFAARALMGRWDDLLSGASGVLAPDNLILLYLSFAFIKAIHELGHGFASKWFGRKNGCGGEVHTMGIMLLVFTPVPYVDASSSWAFRSKWHRAAVGAAGMYVELAVAAIAALVWTSTSPGTVNAVAYNMIFIASVSTLLFNGNPLLRFDGYYILSDVLEIPNLYGRSRDYLYYLVKRYVYGVKRARGVIRSRGERFWLPLYGVSSAIYRVVIFTGIILFVADKFFFIGAIFAIAALVSWLVIPLGKFARYLATNPQLARVRLRAVATSLVAIGLVVAAIGAVPFPDRGRAEGVVEPREVAFMYAREDGFVRSFLPSGTAVAPAGAALVSAMSPDLEATRRRLLAERDLTFVQRNRAKVEEQAVAQSLGERLEAVDTQIEGIDERLAALSLRPTFPGRWIAPEIDRIDGAYLRRGDPVGLVADVDRLLVRAVVDQGLGPRIRPEIGLGGPVELRLRGRPQTHLTGTIEAILPVGHTRLPSAALGYLAGGATRVDMNDETGMSASEPFFEVHVALSPEDAERHRLWSGQRVVVRFEMPSRPLAEQWWRSLRQLVQRRFQI